MKLNCGWRRSIRLTPARQKLDRCKLRLPGRKKNKTKKTTRICAYVHANTKRRRAGKSFPTYRQNTHKQNIHKEKHSYTSHARARIFAIFEKKTQFKQQNKATYNTTAKTIYQQIKIENSNNTFHKKSQRNSVIYCKKSHFPTFPLIQGGVSYYSSKISKIRK